MAGLTLPDQTINSIFLKNGTFLFFFKIFLCGPFFLSLSWTCHSIAPVSHFRFLGHEASGILAPLPETKPAPHALGHQASPWGHSATEYLFSFWREYHVREHHWCFKSVKELPAHWWEKKSWLPEWSSPTPLCQCGSPTVPLGDISSFSGLPSWILRFLVSAVSVILVKRVKWAKVSFLDHKFGGVWEDRNRNDLLIETSRHSLTMSSLVVNERVSKAVKPSQWKFHKGWASAALRDN